MSQKKRPGRPRKYPKQEHLSEIHGIVGTPQISGAVVEMVYSSPQTIKKIVTFLSSLNNSDTVGIEFYPEFVRMRARNSSGGKSRITDNLFVEIVFHGNLLNSYFYDKEVLGDHLSCHVPSASIVERINKKSGTDLVCFYMYLTEESYSQQLEIRFDWKFHNNMYHRVPSLAFSRIAKLDWDNAPECDDSWKMQFTLDVGLLRGIVTGANLVSAQEIKFLQYNEFPFEISYSSKDSQQWKTLCEDKQSINLRVADGLTVADHIINTSTLQCILQGMLGPNVTVSTWNDFMSASVSLSDGAVNIVVSKSPPDN